MVVARAATVARAAPSIPRAGTGPQPKMRRGSRTTFTRPATDMMTAGTRVSPVARMALLPIMGTTTKTEPRNHTRM